jgi:4-hydroxyphenylpyruvate dioxygenase and related hemolysins
MAESALGTQIIVQIGIIVRDIQNTARKYAEFLGAAPVTELTDPYEQAQVQYKGSPTPARAKLAFFRIPGGVELELIEPDEHPSIWREFLDNHGEGVHHIAFYIKDMKGKVMKLHELGMDLVQKGEYTGGRYAYFDSNADLKVMLELLEND